MTSAGLTLGTLAYMSPEQAAADPHVDGRSDQYSLACVVFEMLVGEAPFTGTSVAEVLVRRFTRPPPRASSRKPGIARHIDGAILTAMARDPNERFVLIERFIEALNAPADARNTASSGESPVPQSRPRSMFLFPGLKTFGDGNNSSHNISHQA